MSNSRTKVQFANEIQVTEQHPDHHYRTEIPNIIFDILTPNEFAVYAHLKRIAGDGGACWMSMSKLAKKVGVGETTLRTIITNLCEFDFYLEGCSLLELYARMKPDGSRDTNLIKIVDIWRLNGDIYRSQAKEKFKGGGGSPDEGGVPRQMRGGGSPGEEKEQPSEEEPSKEQQTTRPTANPVVVVPFPSKLEILKPYGFSHDALLNFSCFDEQQIKDGIAAFEQYREKNQVDNICGCLRNAIVCQWKPNEKKESKQEAQERKSNESKDVLTNNVAEAKRLINNYEYTFNDKFCANLREKVVELKLKKGWYPLSLLEEGCIETLAKYLEENQK